jgi:hypothetical protein
LQKREKRFMSMDVRSFMTNSTYDPFQRGKLSRKAIRLASVV